MIAELWATALGPFAMGYIVGDVAYKIWMIVRS